MKRIGLGGFIALALFASIGGVSSDLRSEGVKQFTARAFGDDLFDGFRFKDAKDNSQELVFSPHRRTPVFEVADDAREVLFYRLATNEEGREIELPIAVADLSEVESRALVVLLAMRDGQRSLPFTALVADESPGRFDAGRIRFLNLSGPRLMARVGESSFPLEFGFGEDLILDPESGVEFPFEFAVRLENRWKIVYSSGLRAHPQVGTLAILKPPALENSLQIQVELTAERVYPTEEITNEGESEE